MGRGRRGGGLEEPARDQDTVQRLLAAHGGVVFKTVGDAIYAAFTAAPDAVAAALAAQRGLESLTSERAAEEPLTGRENAPEGGSYEPFPEPVKLRVRTHPPH